MTSTISIRPATIADHGTINRLAALDSARVPTGEILIAEVGNEPHAAIDLNTGAVIADPFRPTREVVELLAVRARAA